MKLRNLFPINIVLLSGFFLLLFNSLALSIEFPQPPLPEAIENFNLSIETPVPNSIQDYNSMEWDGHLSGQKEEFVKVVVEKVEWDELWRRAFDRPAPEVDFENYAVACVFLGHSADWLYSIGFGEPYERDYKLVIPYSLADIIIELSGPFKASGQYHMKALKKTEGFEMILEDTTGLMR